MKNFIKNLIEYDPKYTEEFPSKFNFSDFTKDLKNRKLQSYSSFRSQSCADCDSRKLTENFRQVCDENESLMTLICTEEDEIFGLSQNRDAYYLLGQSNIINTYNQRGEAMGCMRRFSEVLSHKEVHYPALKDLFPPLQSFLREKHGERFLQGRVFFFGAGKEFESKGLTNLYVKDQSFEVESKLKPEPLPQSVVVTKKAEKVPGPKLTKSPDVVKAPSIVRIREKEKSAFLQTAELRATENLPKLQVDMMKFKYDYVFSLNMINNLSSKLKAFMTRDALKEMVTYDKLGGPEGPVPLLFLKYMMDMEEHQGIWNIVSVLGPRFYVSNEIDGSFKPRPELIELVNDQGTNNQWQIFILRP